MDFLGIGPTELLFTIVVALIVLGPAKMMELTRSLGKILREIRRTTSELPDLLSLEEGPSESSSMTEGDDRAQQPKGNAQGREGPDEG